MQGTCLKTEWCTWNYIFMSILFTFDPGEVAWISFGPKNAACSQNSLNSDRLLHPCSVVSMPCALDQAIVVHDPLHRWVSCFTFAFNDGRKCVCLRFWERFIGYAVREVLWRQISNDVGQHISTSVVGNYVIQGSLTSLRCRDEGPGAILCRTTMPLLAELRSSQIYCRPLSRFGSHQFLDNRVAKNYPTPVDVYQLTHVLQQVWQSKLFRPSSSPWVSAA